MNNALKKIFIRTGILAFGVIIILAYSSMAYSARYVIEKYDTDHAFNGTTLFADNSDPDNPRIVEVDMRGNTVWDFRVPDSLFPDFRKRYNIVMDVERLPNNHILFNIQKVGIYEIERGGKLVWKHEDTETSHDVDRLPNGNTLYVRGWVRKGGKHVIEIDPSGKEVWSWDGMRHFDREPFSNIHHQGWMHVNGVTRLSNGNTLISIRNFNMIVEVDPEGMPVWKYQFKSRSHPHDPELLPDNHLLIPITSANRVIEIDRVTKTPVWEWTHPNGARPIAHIRDANRLPNGNTLIVEANRITEVMPDGEIVWRLRIPSIDIDSKRFKFLYKAERIR